MISGQPALPLRSHQGVFQDFHVGTESETVALAGFIGAVVEHEAILMSVGERIPFEFRVDIAFSSRCIGF